MTKIKPDFTYTETKKLYVTAVKTGWDLAVGSRNVEGMTSDSPDIKKNLEFDIEDFWYRDTGFDDTSDVEQIFTDVIDTESDFTQNLGYIIDEKTNEIINYMNTVMTQEERVRHGDNIFNLLINRGDISYLKLSLLSKTKK